MIDLTMGKLRKSKKEVFHLKKDGS